MGNQNQFLTDLRISTNCITEYDYIKPIMAEKESHQVVALMKVVFPDHWHDLAQRNMVDLSPLGREYILGYFTSRGDLVGSVHLCEVELYNMITIQSYQVKRECRQKGIATSLFKTIRKIARRKGFVYLYLLVEITNRVAIRAYKSWGFQKLPTIHQVEKLGLTPLIPTLNGSNLVFRLLTEQDYKEYVLPFMNRHFTVYMEVFQRKKFLEPATEENRAYGLFQDDRLRLFLSEDPNTQQLDIYVPESFSQKLDLLRNLRACNQLHLNDYTSIMVLGNLELKEHQQFQDHGIIFTQPHLYQGYYYALE